ncbi:unnamed protein product [Staurois parvus]|uniref:Uncharacterized protein n=1 Tax=Staurois parvus TaxID=386267 RepID=A0ABN9FQ03_9NEOB|nr:unnamed protein product [Staurois parvus]
MGRSQELSELKHGTVIGCHMCNKFIRESSLVLNIPHSTVSGIITKWEQQQLSHEVVGHHWTLEQWRRVLWSDESRFSVWQSDGCVWV